MSIPGPLETGVAQGGHLVQGHVDATTEVVERSDLEAHCEVAFALAPEYAAFVVEKGSVPPSSTSTAIHSSSTGTEPKQQPGGKRVRMMLEMAPSCISAASTRPRTRWACPTPTRCAT